MIFRISKQFLIVLAFLGYSCVFILAVTLNFSITIGKIKQGSLSILELVWGVILQGGFVLEPTF